MQIKRLALAAVLGLSAATAVTASASADTAGQYRHPSREMVDARLADLDRRIRDERRAGEIGGRDARHLHREVRSIRAQERADLRFDRGHLTSGEYRKFIREENGLSHKIGR